MSLLGNVMFCKITVLNVGQYSVGFLDPTYSGGGEGKGKHTHQAHPHPHCVACSRSKFDLKIQLNIAPCLVLFCYKR